MLSHVDYCLFADNWKNDIALVKLTQDLPLAPLDDTIDAVRLPDVTPWPSPGASCSVQGWGCTQAGKHSVVATFCSSAKFTYRPRKSVMSFAPFR